MNTHALFELAGRGLVERLNLLSLEGGIYLLEIHAEQNPQLLRDEKGQVLKMRSVEDARKRLKGIQKTPFFLVHSSAYSEMCGLDSAPLAPLSVPISLAENA